MSGHDGGITGHVAPEYPLKRILYSAPFALVSKTLSLRATDAAVAMYGGYRHVATHLSTATPGSACHE